MMSNEEDTCYEDATGTISIASLAYKLADNVTYSVAGAYGQINSDRKAFDPDPFARVYHKIQIDF